MDFMTFRPSSSNLISLTQAFTSTVSTVSSWKLSPLPAFLMPGKHHSICFNLNQARHRVNVAGGQCREVTSPHLTIPLSSLTGKTWNVNISRFLPLPFKAYLSMSQASFSHSTAFRQVRLMPHSKFPKSPSLAPDPLSSFLDALQSLYLPPPLSCSHTPNVWRWPYVPKSSRLHLSSCSGGLAGFGLQKGIRERGLLLPASRAAWDSASRMMPTYWFGVTHSHQTLGEFRPWATTDPWAWAMLVGCALALSFSPSPQKSQCPGIHPYTVGCPCSHTRALHLPTFFQLLLSSGLKRENVSLFLSAFTLFHLSAKPSSRLIN